jgi:hypothetical protein
MEHRGLDYEDQGKYDLWKLIEQLGQGKWPRGTSLSLWSIIFRDLVFWLLL